MGTQLSGIVIKKDNIWFNYNTQNTNLPEDYITCITHENQFVKWAGTYNSGVVRLEEPNTNLTSFSIELLKLYPTIIRVYESLFLSEPVDGMLTILDEMGRIVNELKLIGASEINSCIRNKGIYFLKLTTHNRTYNFKIVVN
jgi:hypothetical protein